MPDEKDSLSQDDLARLLGQQSANPSPSQGTAEDPPQASVTGSLSQGEIEALIEQGASASEPGSAPASPAPTPDGSEAGKPLASEEIEQFLGQAGEASSPAPQSPPSSDRPRDTSPGNQDAIPQGDVEYLLNQAQRALESLDSESASAVPPGLAPFALEELRGQPASSDTATLDLISDVKLDLKIELGRTNMYLEDVLRLRRGSVVPLDKLAGDPVDIYVNERLIARGEVLVLNDNFCVRVGELIAGTNPGG
jgi:flagellar motor switch protein FliN/FliY